MQTSLCIIIPLYKITLSSSELAALRANLYTSQIHGIDCCIIVPQQLDLSKLPKMLLNEMEQSHIVRFEDAYFTSTRSYDFLMMSKEFYSAFDSFTHVLICQLDALILSVSMLQRWLEEDVSYVGAPWFYGCHKPNSTELAKVGNGGFSLRNVSDHIMAINTLTRVSPFAWVDLESDGSNLLRRGYFTLRNLLFSRTDGSMFHLRCHEDYFFGVIASRALENSFRVPSPSRAITFSYEVNPRLLHRRNNFELPAGCHAWERYDPEFWLETFEEVGHVILNYL